MPNFVTDDKRMVTIEPHGGVALDAQQIRDLAAYHAFQARHRVAATPNIDPDNVYRFRVTLPTGRERDFMHEFNQQLRGLEAQLDAGMVTVKRKSPVTTTIELPAEIYEVLRLDAEKLGVKTEERLQEMIRLSQRYRFVESERDRQAELDVMAEEQMAARQ